MFRMCKLLSEVRCAAGSLQLPQDMWISLTWSLSVDCLAAPGNRKPPCSTGAFLPPHPLLLPVVPFQVPVTIAADWLKGTSLLDWLKGTSLLFEASRWYGAPCVIRWWCALCEIRLGSCWCFILVLPVKYSKDFTDENPQLLPTQLSPGRQAPLWVGPISTKGGR